MVGEPAVDGVRHETGFHRAGVTAGIIGADIEASKGVSEKSKILVVGELEAADAIRRRIDEAARLVPIEQLCLSPQCGFSSTVHGNDISVENQRAKLALVVDVARRVWGEA